MWLAICIGFCVWLGYSLGGALGAIAGAVIGPPLSVIGYCLLTVIQHGIECSRSTEYWLRCIESERVAKYGAALSQLKYRGESIKEYERRTAEGLSSDSPRERQQYARLIEEIYHLGRELREADYDPFEPKEVCIDKAKAVFQAIDKRKEELDRVDEQKAIDEARAKVRQEFLKDTDRTFSICPLFREAQLIITDGGDALGIPEGTRLPGELNIVPWEPYFEQVRFAEPSYCRVRFDFKFEKQDYRYEGEIFLHELLFDDGEVVQEEWLDFEDQIGEIQDLPDYRRKMSYTLPDGSSRTFFVKYMDTYYAMMFEPERMVVRCRHYDTSGSCRYLVVYLTRDWSQLLFRKASKIFYDAEGHAEDADPHAEDFVRVTRI